MLTSITGFAGILEVSRQQVTDYIDQGLPCERKGKGRAAEIQTGPALRWLLERAKGQTGTVSTENARLKRAQAARIERENRVAEGELISIEDGRIVVEEALVVLCAGLDALGPRLAPKLTHVWDAGKIQRIVREATDEMRRETADRLARLADLGERASRILPFRRLG